MTVITCWYRLVGEEIGFNHISDGFDDTAAAPTPRTEYQRLSWGKQVWDSRRALLVDNVVTDEEP